MFSDVSRSFCSTENNPEEELAVAPGVWCICLFMWKMFYVLFIPSGNDGNDDDSWLNGRTLINLSPKSTMEFYPFWLNYKIVHPTRQNESWVVFKITVDSVKELYFRVICTIRNFLVRAKKPEPGRVILDFYLKSYMHLSSCAFILQIYGISQHR